MRPSPELGVGAEQGEGPAIPESEGVGERDPDEGAGVLALLWLEGLARFAVGEGEPALSSLRVAGPTDAVQRPSQEEIFDGSR